MLLVGGRSQKSGLEPQDKCLVDGWHPAEWADPPKMQVCQVCADFS